MKKALLVLVTLSLTIVLSAQIAWGRNDFGQCDVPLNHGCSTVAAGDYHCVGRWYDGSLVAWGNNGYDQCNVPAGNDFTAVASKGNFSVARRANGTIVAWGDNTYGQCNTPGGNDFALIAAGVFHGLALKSDGSLVTWGNVGNGLRDVPAGNDYVAIAAGLDFSLALKADQSIVAWGNLNDGMADVPAGNGYITISAGYTHAVALKTDQTAVAWGNNSYGQCDVPAEMRFYEVSAGANHNLAIRINGSLIAWGSNSDGQCNVPTGYEYAAVVAGSSYSLAFWFPHELPDPHFAFMTADFHVSVNWVTETETGLQGFDIYRCESNILQDAIKINPQIIPATNTSDQHIYTYLDDAVESQHTYYYWLAQLSVNNDIYLSGPDFVTITGNTTPQMPGESWLGNVYPNPVRPGQTGKIELSIKGGEKGTFSFFNLKGQTIRTYQIGEGDHSFHLQDINGHVPSSGVYFYRLDTPSYKRTIKFIFIK